ncbi:MAG: MATE family efflux transporter, partial [Oscillospiraceae bacterium]|nr:MATE family efflux transporter [Oscillospiraceae bacterium]
MEAIKDSRLNKPITVRFLLTFTLPTILSFIIMGIFGTIDGIFASRGISPEALSAINFVLPFFTFTMAIGAMLSMGGSALVAKKKGGGLKQEARENFTLLILVTFATSVLTSGISWFARVPLLRMLGTDVGVFDLALEYLQPLILMMPFIMVGLVLVQFLIAEGRPVLGMFASSSGAVVSTALNAIFIFVLDLGVMGLALATGIGYAVPAVLGIIYFAGNRKGTIYFVRPNWDVKALGRSSLNGISEMITMMATTVTMTVMNNVLVRLVGWEGVAAAGMVLAAQAILASLFFGYSSGIAPVVSYNFGEKMNYGKESEAGQERHSNLKKLYKKVC